MSEIKKNTYYTDKPTTVYIRLDGIAYDSSLTQPTTMVIRGGRDTREEYGINLGITEHTKEMISKAIEKVQLDAWSYIDPKVFNPCYEGSEINIPEPWVLTLGTIYKPKNIKEEIPDGTPITVVCAVRAFSGRRKKGVVINLCHFISERQRFVSNRSTEVSIESEETKNEEN